MRGMAKLTAARRGPPVIPAPPHPVPGRIPLIGFHLDEAILATGYAPALTLLDGRIERDERGFALRSDRVTSRNEADLYFVGHNYDVAGGLFNIARDAPLVAERIKRTAAEPAARRQPELVAAGGDSRAPRGLGSPKEIPGGRR